MSLQEVLNKVTDEKAKGELLLEHAKDQEELATILQYTQDPSPFIRAAATQALGKRGSRKVYESLIKMLDDSDEIVREDAIIALGESQDSRVLFAYANLWYSRPELRQRLVLGLGALNDPRSPQLIDKILQDIETEYLQQQLKRTKESARCNNNFVYTYQGSEERRVTAKKAQYENGPRQLKSQGTLHTMQELLEQRVRELQNRPQTYVIPQGEEFMILGGNIDEHVDVARGRNVHTAGEVLFERRAGIWRVTYINNRSNGYFPETNFCRVQKALAKAQIEHPNDFTETFPKEGYFTDDFLSLQPFYPSA